MYMSLPTSSARFRRTCRVNDLRLLFLHCLLSCPAERCRKWLIEIEQVLLKALARVFIRYEIDILEK